MQAIKCVVVGDEGIGKTSMLSTAFHKEFPKDNVHKVIDNLAVLFMADGKPINIGLWDTPGSEEYDRLRPLSYPQTDVMIIAFSVVDRVSFENVKRKWHTEITHHCSHTPILIVGTKIDLRTDELTLQELSKNGNCPVTEKEGKQLVSELSVNGYFEVSALLNTGIFNRDGIIEQIVMACTGWGWHRQRALNNKKKEESCILL